MPTDGTDVKVYTVGPDYAHAEARKSPGEIIADAVFLIVCTPSEIIFSLSLSPSSRREGRTRQPRQRNTISGHFK